MIVNLWRNRAPKPDGERVYLTNAAVSAPWAVVAGYDDRSGIVEAPDHQIAQVVHKVIDARTGEVRVPPAAKRTQRTHLASRMEEIYTPPTKPTVPVWSHEQGVSTSATR